MGNVYVFDHPLIQHKLTHIRDKNTGTKEFRELVEEVSALMAYEITRDMPLTEVTVETPVAPARCKVLSGKKLGLVPILRAGLGMVDGILRLIPTAKVGHIGLYRDPDTLESERRGYRELAARLPHAIVLDASGDAEALRRRASELIWRVCIAHWRPR